jgi:hypothetical protein
MFSFEFQMDVGDEILNIFGFLFGGIQVFREFSNCLLSQFST